MSIREILLYLSVLAILGGLFVLCSYYESQTYNRLTGAQTTWWDAMWVQLRVQDQPRKADQK